MENFSGLENVEIVSVTLKIYEYLQKQKSLLGISFFFAFFLDPMFTRQGTYLPLYIYRVCTYILI